MDAEARRVRKPVIGHALSPFSAHRRPLFMSRFWSETPLTALHPGRFTCHLINEYAVLQVTQPDTVRRNHTVQKGCAQGVDQEHKDVGKVCNTQVSGTRDVKGTGICPDSSGSRDVCDTRFYHAA